MAGKDRLRRGDKQGCKVINGTVRNRIENPMCTPNSQIFSKYAWNVIGRNG
ncbi:MAG: hypothetical protein VX278_03805 [Myxococcota bacterium]|nr:hypothetical protein [Myxococcota bacterium]